MGTTIAGEAATLPGMAVPTTAAEAAAGGWSMGTAMPVPAGVGGASSGGGLLGSVMSNKYVVPALLQAGSGMLTSVAQQRAAAQARQDEYAQQKAMTDEQRARYQTNVGTSLWGKAPRG